MTEVSVKINEKWKAWSKIITYPIGKNLIRSLIHTIHKSQFKMDWRPTYRKQNNRDFKQDIGPGVPKYLLSCLRTLHQTGSGVMGYFKFVREAQGYLTLYTWPVRHHTTNSLALSTVDQATVP